MRGVFYMYVPNVDATYRKAIQAGGKSFQEPRDKVWGDRIGIVEDRAGNRWWLATQKTEVTDDELIKSVTQRSKENAARKRS
jgi:PhnB protein